MKEKLKMKKLQKRHIVAFDIRRKNTDSKVSAKSGQAGIVACDLLPFLATTSDKVLDLHNTLLFSSGIRGG